MGGWLGGVVLRFGVIHCRQECLHHFEELRSRGELASDETQLVSTSGEEVLRRGSLGLAKLLPMEDEVRVL